MKKFFKIAISIIMIALLCFSLIGCADKNNDCADENQGPVIQYEKKYGLGDNYYVFYSDGTGYYEIHRENNDYTLSGKIEFRWETASDNMVYLFSTNRIYYDDHTEGKTISMDTYPLAFGKDFFAYSYTKGSVIGGNGNINSYRSRYIVEGSDLAKAID